MMEFSPHKLWFSTIIVLRYTQLILSTPTLVISNKFQDKPFCSLTSINIGDCRCSCSEKNNIQCVKDEIVARSFAFPSSDLVRVTIPKFTRDAAAITIQNCDVHVVLESMMPTSGRRILNHLQLKIENVTSLEIQSNAFQSLLRRSRNLGVNIDLSRIPSLKLTQGSFSGNQLQNIILNNCTMESIPSNTFLGLSLQSLTIENSFLSILEPNSLGRDLKARTVVIKGNRLDSLKRHGINLTVTESMEISNNDFDETDTEAFLGITLQKGKLEFKHNRFQAFEPGLLAFSTQKDEQVHLENLTFSSPCECSMVQNDISPNFIKSVFCGESRETLSKFWMEDCISMEHMGRSIGNDKAHSLCALCACTDTSIRCNCQEELEREKSEVDQNAITYFELTRCGKLEMSMKMIMDFQNLELLNVSHIETLRIAPLQSPRGKRTLGLEVLFENVTISDAIKPDTFCGPNFRGITFKQSQIHFIDRKAFHDMEGLQTLEFNEVNITGDISKEAFANVSVTTFTLHNSLVDNLDQKALDLRVLEAFVLANTTFRDVHNGALSHIHLQNPTSTLTLANITITSGYEPGSLALNPEIVEGDQLLVKRIQMAMECSCPMHEIEMIHTEHHTRSHHELSHLITRLWCWDQDGTYHKWMQFDFANCTDEAGHDHSFLSYDERGLHVNKYALIAIVLALFLIIAIVVALILKYKQNPILAPHLPIMDENEDDNWKRVSFEALRYRSKSSSAYDRMELQRRKDSMEGMLQTPGYNTHPSPKLHHRVSIKSLKGDDGLMHETEMFEPQSNFDRTLDIIQDTHPDRISARLSMPPVIGK